MKILIAAVCCVLAWANMPSARADELPPRGGYTLRVDWQVPQQLPPHFRNHCTYDSLSGRPYCSDHCGIDFQFYACSEVSFGCCHIGHGYCDWNGQVRCHP